MFVSLEGKREKVLCDFFEELFNTRENSINITYGRISGEHPDAILLNAIKQRFNYDRVYAWFDEAKVLSQDIKNSLSNTWNIPDLIKTKNDKDLQKLNTNNKNPILIVSNPCSIDGFLIDLLGKKLPEPLTEKNCKNSFSGIVGSKFNEETEMNFYKTNLTKEILENQKNNSILQLILSIFKKY